MLLLIRARFGLKVAPNFLSLDVFEKWNVAYHNMQGDEDEGFLVP